MISVNINISEVKKHRDSKFILVPTSIISVINEAKKNINNRIFLDYNRDLLVRLKVFHTKNKATKFLNHLNPIFLEFLELIVEDLKDLTPTKVQGITFYEVREWINLLYTQLILKHDVEDDDYKVVKKSIYETLSNRIKKAKNQGKQITDNEVYHTIELLLKQNTKVIKKKISFEFKNHHEIQDLSDDGYYSEFCDEENRIRNSIYLLLIRFMNDGVINFDINRDKSLTYNPKPKKEIEPNSNKNKLAKALSLNMTAGCSTETFTSSGKAIKKISFFNILQSPIDLPFE